MIFFQKKADFDNILLSINAFGCGIVNFTVFLESPACLDIENRLVCRDWQHNRIIFVPNISPQPKTTTSVYSTCHRRR